MMGGMENVAGEDDLYYSQQQDRQRHQQDHEEGPRRRRAKRSQEEEDGNGLGYFPDEGGDGEGGFGNGGAAPFQIVPMDEGTSSSLAALEYEELEEEVFALDEEEVEAGEVDMDAADVKANIVEVRRNVFMEDLDEDVDEDDGRLSPVGEYTPPPERPHTRRIEQSYSDDFFDPNMEDDGGGDGDGDGNDEEEEDDDYGDDAEGEDEDYTDEGEVEGDTANDAVLGSVQQQRQKPTAEERKQKQQIQKRLLRAERRRNRSLNRKVTKLHHKHSELKHMVVKLQLQRQQERRYFEQTHGYPPPYDDVHDSNAAPSSPTTSPPKSIDTHNGDEDGADTRVEPTQTEHRAGKELVEKMWKRFRQVEGQVVHVQQVLRKGQQRVKALRKEHRQAKRLWLKGQVENVRTEADSAIRLQADEERTELITTRLEQHREMIQDARQRLQSLLSHYHRMRHDQLKPALVNNAVEFSKSVTTIQNMLKAHFSSALALESVELFSTPHHAETVARHWRRRVEETEQEMHPMRERVRQLEVEIDHLEAVIEKSAKDRERARSKGFAGLIKSTQNQAAEQKEEAERSEQALAATVKIAARRGSVLEQRGTLVMVAKEPAALSVNETRAALMRVERRPRPTQVEMATAATSAAASAKVMGSLGQQNKSPPPTPNAATTNPPLGRAKGGVVKSSSGVGSDGATGRRGGMDNDNVSVNTEATGVESSAQTPDSSGGGASSVGDDQCEARQKQGREDGTGPQEEGNDEAGAKSDSSMQHVSVEVARKEGRLRELEVVLKQYERFYLRQSALIRVCYRDIRSLLRRMPDLEAVIADKLEADGCAPHVTEELRKSVAEEHDVLEALAANEENRPYLNSGGGPRPRTRGAMALALAESRPASAEDGQNALERLDGPGSPASRERSHKQQHQGSAVAPHKPKRPTSSTRPLSYKPSPRKGKRRYRHSASLQSVLSSVQAVAGTQEAYYSRPAYFRHRMHGEQVLTREEARRREAHLTNALQDFCMDASATRRENEDAEHRFLVEVALRDLDTAAIANENNIAAREHALGIIGTGGGPNDGNAQSTTMINNNSRNAGVNGNVSDGRRDAHDGELTAAHLVSQRSEAALTEPGGVTAEEEHEQDLRDPFTDASAPLPDGRAPPSSVGNDNPFDHGVQRSVIVFGSGDDDEEGGGVSEAEADSGNQAVAGKSSDDEYDDDDYEDDFDDEDAPMTAQKKDAEAKLDTGAAAKDSGRGHDEDKRDSLQEEHTKKKKHTQDSLVNRHFDQDAEADSVDSLSSFGSDEDAFDADDAARLPFSDKLRTVLLLDDEDAHPKNARGRRSSVASVIGNNAPPYITGAQVADYMQRVLALTRKAPSHRMNELTAAPAETHAVKLGKATVGTRNEHWASMPEPHSEQSGDIRDGKPSARANRHTVAISSSSQDGPKPPHESLPRSIVQRRPGWT